MAGRLAWILAGGAAIVGGMVFQDDWFKFESREHNREVAEAIAEAKSEAGEPVIRAQIVDGDGRQIDATSDEVQALTDAVAELVKAEAAVAVAEMGKNADPGEVAAARAHRDQARAVVDALKADFKARERSVATENQIRDQVREQVKQEVRDAVNGG